MKQIHLSPTEYHSKEFNRMLLPDIVAAGPISASLLSKVRDPLGFLLGTGKTGTKSMKWGNLVDCLWLTPEDFETSYVFQPEGLKKPTKAQRDAAKPQQKSIDQMAAWDEFEASVGNREIIKPQQYEDAKSALRMLNQHPIAREIYEASQKQVVLEGPTPLIAEGDVMAKCMIDLLPMTGRFVDAVPDLKTNNDPSDHKLAATMWSFEYHMKLAFYGIHLEAAGLGHRPRGILIWQRSSYPFDVHVREVDPVDMDLGRMIAVSRLNTLLSLDAARISDHFDTELSVLSLTNWQRTSADLGGDEPEPREDGAVD